MRLIKYLNEQEEIWEGMNVDELIEFFNKLNISKKPKDISKTDHTLLKDIKATLSSVEEMRKNNSPDLDVKILELEGKLQNLRISKDEIENNYGKGKKNVVKTNYAKYIKQDTTSYETFQENIKNIDDFISELDNYHRKVTKNLVIRFVDSKVQSGIAKYIDSEDVLQINAKKVGGTKEEYGSLRYVVLHELGHRFLRMFPQRWDYDDDKWITTKYSRTESLSGEEKFAELFALSHWKRKYSEFEDQIKAFEKRLEL